MYFRSFPLDVTVHPRGYFIMIVSSGFSLTPEP
jgi:hypothetical protein